MIDITNRSKLVKFRVTPQQLIQIDELASRSGENRSEYLMRVAFSQQAPPSVIDRQTYEMLVQVKQSLTRIEKLLAQNPQDQKVIEHLALLKNTVSAIGLIIVGHEAN
jgi:uncharacterized protein (DUF1778 family)